MQSFPPPSSPTPLTDLLRRVQKKGPASSRALNELVAAWYRIVARYLRPRCRQWRDANDVLADATQESIVRLYLARDSCRATTDDALVAWVCTVARNTMIDLLRSPRAGLKDRGRFIDWTLAEFQAASCTQPSPLIVAADVACGGRPLASGAHQRLLELTVDAAHTQPEPLNELLWLRLVRGAEWSDIAKALGTTSAGTKRRYQRAQVAIARVVDAQIDSTPSAERVALRSLIARYRT